MAELAEVEVEGVAEIEVAGPVGGADHTGMAELVRLVGPAELVICRSRVVDGPPGLTVGGLLVAEALNRRRRRDGRTG